jgi:predicted PurR-regulated permease PerM
VATFVDKFPEYVGQLQAFAADPKRPWLRKIIGLGLKEAGHSATELTTVGADWISAFLRSVWSDSRTVISIFSLLIVTPIVTVYLLKDGRNSSRRSTVQFRRRSRRPFGRSPASSMIRSQDSYAGKGPSA